MKGLHSGNIEFARLTEVSPADLIALMNDPRVRRHLPLAGGVFGAAQYDQFVAAKERMWQEKGYGPWAFLIDGRFAGWGGLQPEGGDADVGMVLLPKYWGFGKALYERIIRYAFDELRLDTVIALLPASRTRVGGMKRLGFRADGQVLLNGERFFRYRLNAQYPADQGHATTPRDGPQGASVVETERLVLRRISLEDAEFILGLLNEPSFIRFIGDKGVRTIEDAHEYITTGPLASYDRLGFGLYLTVLRSAGEPIGICGLLKRDSLEDVDIGFAFKPRFWSQGYAYEAAAAVMAYARDTLGLARIVAVTAPDNEGSIRLLEKLGMRFERMTRLSADEPDVRLFATETRG